jgi:hypothetical protein
MEIENRGTTFFNEVAEKTTAKKLKWKEQTEEDVFLTSLGGKYIVRSFPFATYNEDQMPVGEGSLTLYEGNEILLDVTPETPGVTGKKLKELHETIRRQVYRIEEKEKSLQDALSLLKNL